MSLARCGRGLVGSISHSRELAAATILRGAVGVGIDIERQRRLTVDAVRRVATKEEYSRYSVVPDFDWTLLFSAKESVFKAFSPLARDLYRISGSRTIVRCDDTIFLRELFWYIPLIKDCLKRVRVTGVHSRGI